MTKLRKPSENQRKMQELQKEELLEARLSLHELQEELERKGAELDKRDEALREAKEMAAIETAAAVKAAEDKAAEEKAAAEPETAESQQQQPGEKEWRSAAKKEETRPWQRPGRKKT